MIMTDFLTYEQEVMERVKKMHEALIRGEIPEERRKRRRNRMILGETLTIGGVGFEHVKLGTFTGTGQSNVSDANVWASLTCPFPIKMLYIWDTSNLVTGAGTRRLTAPMLPALNVEQTGSSAGITYSIANDDATDLYLLIYEYADTDGYTVRWQLNSPSSAASEEYPDQIMFNHHASNPLAYYKYMALG